MSSGMAVYGAVILAAVLAAFGWILRRHFADDKETANHVEQLREDVSFIRGVLSMAFPTTSARVKEEKNGH